jgi:acyl carrier protein
MPETDFINVIRGHLKYLKPGEELDADKSLKLLGLDSMAAIDLLLDIEDVYGVTLPDRYLTDETFSTTRALWNVVFALKEGLEVAQPCPA